jgi:hypothetical protein
MVPMIDSLMIPGTIDAIVTVGPATLGVMAVLAATVAWVARRTSEELRRTAAREWERRNVAALPASSGRLAA